MPLWSPLVEQIQGTNEHETRDNTLDIYVDKILLSIGYFSKFYEFELLDDNFKECKLFKQGKSSDVEITDEKVVIKYSDNKQSWYTTDQSKIVANDTPINFQKIILDFLFELDNLGTFEDENFFKLQAALQNNKLLDALSRKCQYLDELYKLRNFQWNTTDKKLPKKFRSVEKSWLNVCFQQQYHECFTHPDSIFKSSEEEAELVLFKTRLGTLKRSRASCFKKADANLRNKAASFFLGQYSIYNAFKSLMSPFAIWLFLIISLLIPSGDFFLNEVSLQNNGDYNHFVGIFSIGLPLVVIFSFLIKYAKSRINFFRLLLPRLFLGILVGWLFFISTEELWKAALVIQFWKIVTLNIVSFFIILLYIITEIRNKLVRQTDITVLKRSIGIIFLAMVISFIQGFYVIQLTAKPMLENSEFLEKILTKNKNFSLDIVLDSDLVAVHKLEDEERDKLANKEPIYNGKLVGEIKNYKRFKIFNRNIYIRYIWSIHLSQFMMAILIGVVLQLLWEDRPITEPL